MVLPLLLQLQALWQETIRLSRYESRLEEIKLFNRQSSHLKRGIALIPTMHGVGFVKEAEFMHQVFDLSDFMFFFLCFWVKLVGMLRCGVLGEEYEIMSWIGVFKTTSTYVHCQLLLAGTLVHVRLRVKRSAVNGSFWGWDEEVIFCFHFGHVASVLGRGTRACLCRWQCASQPWRCWNGAGIAYEDGCCCGERTRDPVGAGMLWY